MKADHRNKVSLLGTYGGDITHACSAWTSTSRDLDAPDKKGITKRERIPHILKMLAESHHETPFEKSAIHFLVTTEIVSHIHFLKHRIGVSINGESARYKELKDDKFFVPQDWPEEEVVKYIAHMENCLSLYHITLQRLIDGGMDRKRAKESARFYIPYGNQIQADIMFNFRSFCHFLVLRYSVLAQKEIRDIAREMLELVDQTGQFEQTLKAFGLKGDDGALCEPFE